VNEEGDGEKPENTGQGSNVHGEQAPNTIGTLADDGSIERKSK
jgi:hypothetical protein